MTERERLEGLAEELAGQVDIPAEEWDQILDQVQRVLQAVRSLDQLCLDHAEPAPVFEVIPRAFPFPDGIR